ncbi:MAG: tRNA (adenosine(37)-N6)-threonylcarbamoyltransferase complex transferase subunit TsaD, partial [Deltaproteobacteria bacterium RIFCSPLOWO2_01_44_7]
MKVLGIETSCDETAIAVVEGKKILSNVVASQAAAHAPYGGVVPEIASRHHVENLPVILEMALKEANISLEKIDAVAATHTPGLLGALLIGLQFGKSLAFALQKPFIGVNHLEGHLASVFLENEELEYPYLGLIVSGGHTHLYLVKEFGCYQLLGATRDDACGEAYDKIAKMLGLGFPGGPLLDKTATRGNPKAFRFTQPKVGECLDFSFSGFKTAALLFVQKQN